MSVNIENVNVLLGGRLVKSNISIRDGRIGRISKVATDRSGFPVIDGRHLLAFPGLIDVHVHLRDMELAYKEDFSSGTMAAAAGGFTTVLDMPNTRPVTNSPARLVEKIEKARSRIHVDVGFYGTLAETPSEIRNMIHAGAVAFKLYMNDPDQSVWHRNHERLLSSLRECGSLQAPVAVHAEDGATITRIQHRLQSLGSGSTDDFMKAHSPKIEYDATRKIVSLAHRARSAVHVCHVSTQEALKTISLARRRGHNVTCEATPHHLFLDRKLPNQKGGIALMVPPLRNRSDVEALWNGTRKGELDVIASDHAPHSLEEKNKADFWSVKPGIPGLETTLPLLLTRIHRREIGLAQLVELLAENPARIFGLKGKGRLKEGLEGDVVLIDLKEKHRIDSSKFYSKAHFSPFDGVECVGKPVVTIASGHVVYDHGEIIETNVGKILARRVRP